MASMCSPKLLCASGARAQPQPLSSGPVAPNSGRQGRPLSAALVAVMLALVTSGQPWMVSAEDWIDDQESSGVESVTTQAATGQTVTSQHATIEPAPPERSVPEAVATDPLADRLSTDNGRSSFVAEPDSTAASRIRQPTISAAQAAARVRQLHGGRVLSVNSSRRGDSLGYKVRVLVDGGRVKTVYVRSGTVRTESITKPRSSQRPSSRPGPRSGVRTIGDG